MEYTNRFATYGNRVAQLVLANDDLEGQIGVVTGLSETGLHFSKKVGANVCTINVELANRPGTVLRIVGNASLSSLVNRAKVGDTVRFSGRFHQGAANVQGGFLARKPYFILSAFELKSSAPQGQELPVVNEDKVNHSHME